MLERGCCMVESARCVVGGGASHDRYSTDVDEWGVRARLHWIPTRSAPPSFTHREELSRGSDQPLDAAAVGNLF